MVVSGGNRLREDPPLGRMRWRFGAKAILGELGSSHPLRRWLLVISQVDVTAAVPGRAVVQAGIGSIFPGSRMVEALSLGIVVKASTVHASFSPAAA